MALRILQLTNRLPYPLNDGGNIATYYVTNYLHRFGHHVTLASLNTRKHYTDPAPLRQIADVHTVDIDTTVTLPGLLKGFFSALPYNVSRFVSEEFGQLLVKLLREKQFDVVQMEGIYLAVYLPLIRKHSKVPVVLRAHNVEHKIWQRLSQNEPQLHKRFYLQHLAKKIRYFEETHACLFDGIIPITETDAEWFTSQCPHSKVKSIAAGVHVAKPDDINLQSLGQTVCMLGSLEWAPNVQGLEWFLTGVWPLVLQKLPNATLHVAGKNPPAHLLQRKEPNVVMHGMVADASAFLKQHPVLAVPLMAGGGMRLKVVEAMALGRCIVSTTLGVEGVPVQHNQQVLIADSAADFAAELVRALTDKTLQQQIGANAYKMAYQHYGWEGLVRSFEQFYRELP